MTNVAQITSLLDDLGQGRPGAADRLLPLVYDELRDLASRYFRREPTAHTLQPTALVHEAYLQLVDQTRASFKDRQHFFAVAATAMRRILIDHARTRSRIRRGGGRSRTELDEVIDGCEQMNVDLIALDDALEKLANVDPGKARLVELRFFAGMSVEEAAEALGASPRTVKREWTVAKGWLYRELGTGTMSDGREVEKD